MTRRSPLPAALAGLAALAALLNGLALPLSPPRTGLDPSWRQALVEATDRGWLFGWDVVFTYGPFHQLFTQQASEWLGPLLVGRWLFGLGWAAATLLVGRRLGLRAAAAVPAASLLVGLIASSQKIFGVGDFAMPFLGVLIVLFTLHDRPAPAPARADLGLMAVVASALLLGPLVKLSMLGVVVPALVAVGWWAAAAGPWGAALVLAPALALHLALWSLVAGQPLALLPGFYGGLNRQIVGGYGDAMANIFTAPSVIAVLLTGAGWLAIARLLPPGRRLWIPWAALGLMACTIGKASFVRADPPRGLVPAAMLLGCLILLALWRRCHQPLWPWLLAGLAAAGLLGLAGPHRPARLAAERLAGLRVSLLAPFSGAERQRLAQERRAQLRRLAAAGEHYGLAPGTTADSLPWEITGLLGQGLRYTPRPVLQSYSAYTEDLQRANGAFFRDGSRAPAAVVVDVRDIDRRLPISLDAPALLEMLRHYRYSHRGSKGSLVFRRAAAVPTSVPTAAMAVPRRQPLAWSRAGLLHQRSALVPLPPGDGPLLVALEARPGLERALLGTLWRPFPVWIELLDRRGTCLARYRFIPGARAGLLIRPLVRTNDDLLRLARHEPALGAPAAAIRFTSTGLAAPYGRSVVRLEAP